MSKTRRDVPFADDYFDKLSPEEKLPSLKETFTHIYRTNHWKGSQSLSGTGSSSFQTAELQQCLPEIVKDFEIKIILDLPCGDFNWMRNVDLKVEKYIGADIVTELVQKHQNVYTNAWRTFVELNLVEDPLPPADLLFCRDCLVHLSFAEIRKAFLNIKASEIKYLLTTTFTDCPGNRDVASGDWRILNLQKAPFSLPRPIRLVNERCSEGGGTYSDKSLGLWAVADLKVW